MNSCFSATYSDARASFLEACLRVDTRFETHRHPLRGPQGERLATDVARIGPTDAQSVVIVVSATHGIEGYCGSGLQVGFLLAEDAPAPGPDQALLLVHAINPHGFAWARRVNEDNVDLNRNFVDHDSGDYPENDLFELLAGNIIPDTWDEAAIARCAAAQAALAREHGDVAVRQAIAKGQYRHPHDLHFGGMEATWSNRTLSAICDRHLANARQALLIDVHTGLGPYGYGELMTPSKPGEAGYDRLYALFGDEVHSTTAGQTAYAGSKGSILAGFRPARAGLDFVAVGLEYGTRERASVRRALVGDHWLHLHGTLDSPQGRRIKTDLRDAFYPEEDDWMNHIRERGTQILRRAFRGMR